MTHLIRDPEVPRRRILWREITSYEVLYRHKASGNELVVKTIQPPPKTRMFRTGHGRKKFKAVHIHKHTKECIIVAKAAKKGKKDEILDEELEALEELDAELEELEAGDPEDDDEVEVEVEDDEDEDEDEDEAPKSKKSSKSSKPGKGKSKAGAGKPKQSRSARTDGKVGTLELANAAGIDSRSLRMVLRKHKIAKDEETGRYEWDSLEDKEVKKILKLISSGEAENIKKEGLARLKKQQEEKRAAKKAAKEEGGKKKSSKKSKKSKKVEEDEDDE